MHLLCDSIPQEEEPGCQIQALQSDAYHGWGSWVSPSSVELSYIHTIPAPIKSACLSHVPASWEFIRGRKEPSCLNMESENINLCLLNVGLETWRTWLGPHLLGLPCPFCSHLWSALVDRSLRNHVGRGHQPWEKQL